MLLVDDEFKGWEVIEAADYSNAYTDESPLTRDKCFSALDEFDFRSERPLPYEYNLLKRLINEYEKLKPYKKALNIACEKLAKDYPSITKEDWEEYFLIKVGYYETN